MERDIGSPRLPPIPPPTNQPALRLQKQIEIQNFARLRDRPRTLTMHLACPETRLRGSIALAASLSLVSLLLPPVVAAEPIDFDRLIRPILSDNCFSCHGPDGDQRQADLRLDRRDEAVRSGAI